MMMPFQCNRNREVLNRICQFIDCLFEFKNVTKEQLQIVEAEIQESIRKGRTAHHSDLMWLEKLLSRDMAYMKDEMNPEHVYQKMEKAIHSLMSMDDGKCKLKISILTIVARLTFYNKSIEEVGKSAETVNQVSLSYQAGVCSVTNILTPKSSANSLISLKKDLL